MVSLPSCRFLNLNFQSYTYIHSSSQSRGLYGSGLIPPGTVRTRVTVQKRILRPVAAAPLPPPLPAVDNFEGSYVAVSGRPGQRTVHAVNGRGSVASTCHTIDFGGVHVCVMLLFH